MIKNPKIKAVTCYMDSLSNSLKEADGLFAEEDGKLIINNLDDYLALVRLSYSTMVNSLSECSDKEIKIELGDSLIANSIEGFLNGLLNGKIGLKPNATA